MKGVFRLDPLDITFLDRVEKDRRVGNYAECQRSLAVGTFTYTRGKWRYNGCHLRHSQLRFAL